MIKIKNLLLIIFFTTVSLVKFSAASEETIYDKIDLFSDVLDKINKEYVDDIDQSEAMDAAINGVLQSLDPYSAYMTPDMFDRMQTETSGKFGGLGIEVTMEHGVVKIISPIDNSPASKVGVKAGDYIVKINDIQVQGKSLTEAVELMRGPVGSDIEITVRRRGVKKALIFNITRDFIQVQSVKSRLIDNNIGYIRITSFNENSSNQIKNKLNELDKDNNIKGYILDLRNNPGGLLTQAIKISDFFLNNGEIVSTKGKKSSTFETIGVPSTDCIIILVIVRAVNIEIKTPIARVIANPCTNGASKVPNMGNSIPPPSINKIAQVIRVVTFESRIAGHAR